MAVANKITAAEMVLKDNELKIRNGIGTKFINEFNALDMIELRIKRGNPLSILKMGYSLVMGDEGKILSIEGLEEGNGLKIVFEDGIVDCTINKIKQQKMTDYE
jgi:exonuclease VII large subunit